MSRQIFAPLGAKFRQDRNVWTFPNGSRVAFSHLDRVADADNFQGRNISLVAVDEVGQYADPAPIWRMFGALRSGLGHPTLMLLTGNPGGPGASWQADMFGLIPFPKGPVVKEIEINNRKMLAAVIPSRIQDNPALLKADPEYIDNLHVVGGEALVKAWLEGDYSAIEGAFFSDFREAAHVVDPFPLPAEATFIRSADTGFAKPFSIQWGMVPRDAIRLPDGRAIPRGALVIVGEWYGRKAANVGIEFTIEDVARGIKAYEPELLPDGVDEVHDAVLDPAAWQRRTTGPTEAEAFHTAGVTFRQADNQRLAGWTQVRQRLRGFGGEPGKVGTPMLYIFRSCRDLIRTLPMQVYDELKPEDLDTDGEDHAVDSLRYMCMSRPWAPELPKPKPESEIDPVSIPGAEDPEFRKRRMRRRGR